jgi:hypothetical protein
MRYPMPELSLQVEILDAWLTDAGMYGFTRISRGVPLESGGCQC